MNAGRIASGDAEPGRFARCPESPVFVVCGIEAATGAIGAVYLVVAAGLFAGITCGHQ